MDENGKSPPYLMLGIMMMGTLIAILNNVSLNNALPEIMNDLKIENYSTVQWLTTINMLVSGVLIPTSAFFITKFKSHHLFITAMSTFILGTILAMFAPNFILLLMARIIQATGTAILMPLLMNTMLVSFSREKRGKAMGIYGLIYMMAPVIGPLMSGFIVDHFGWRMIFVFIAPLAFIPLLLAIWKLENILEQKETSIDCLSLCLSTISFTSLLFGLSNAGIYGWGDIKAYGLIVLGIIMLGIFVYRQLKIETPLLDLTVYSYPMFSLSSIIAILLAMILYAPLIIIPLFLQNIQGYTTLQSGLIALPGTFIMAILMPVTGKLYDKIGAKPLAVVGFILIGTSSMFMSFLTLITPVAYIIFWLIIRNIGMSLIIMPMQTNGLNQLPNHLNASGTAVNGTVQQISGAIGTAIFLTLKTHYTSNGIKMLTNEAIMEFGYPISLAVQEELVKQASVEAVNFTAIIASVLSVIALVCSLFVKKRIYQDEDEIDIKLITNEVLEEKNNESTKTKLKKV